MPCSIGSIDFEGEFHSARQAELVLRGPRPQGPPINIAAGGPKMLQLAARYGDGWNWWGWDETLEQVNDRLTPIIEILERSCENEDRDPATLRRTFDLYTVVPESFSSRSQIPAGLDMKQPVLGTSAQLAEYILALGELGFDEVRCDVFPKTSAAVEAMQPVVEIVHAG